MRFKRLWDLKRYWGSWDNIEKIMKFDIWFSAKIQRMIDVFMLRLTVWCLKSTKFVWVKIADIFGSQVHVQCNYLDCAY